MRLITIENAHDLPSFCDELSVGFREISALAQVVSPNGLFVERTGFKACSEASGGFGNLCGPAIGGGSGAHDLRSSVARISSSKDWRACQISGLMEASVR